MRRFVIRGMAAVAAAAMLVLAPSLPAAADTVSGHHENNAVWEFI
ncbi:MAG: hypothetical protein FWJ70_09980 [Micromonosporaceae bacterium]|jgi:hypothetical protein